MHPREEKLRLETTEWAGSNAARPVKSLCSSRAREAERRFPSLTIAAGAVALLVAQGLFDFFVDLHANLLSNKEQFRRG